MYRLAGTEATTALRRARFSICRRASRSTVLAIYTFAILMCAFEKFPSGPALLRPWPVQARADIREMTDLRLTHNWAVRATSLSMGPGTFILRTARILEFVEFPDSPH